MNLIYFNILGKLQFEDNEPIIIDLYLIID